MKVDKATEGRMGRKGQKLFDVCVFFHFHSEKEKNRISIYSEGVVYGGVRKFVITVQKSNVKSTNSI